MAVTVKIDDKTRAPAKRGSKSGPDATGFDAYVLPADSYNGQMALVIWLVLLALICLPWWFFESTLPFAIGMPLWCLFASVGTLWLGPKLTARGRRAAGKGAIISSANQPQIKTLIGKASKILGIAEPEGFLETSATPAPQQAAPPQASPAPPVSREEAGRLKSLLHNASHAAAEALHREEKVPKLIRNLGSPSVRIVPRALLIHKEAFENLDAHEVSALVVRALVHERQGHSRRLFLLDLVETTQPATLLALVWPVLIYAKILHAMWLPHAQQNADRIALFLVKNPNLLLSAILKDIAARDAHMQEMQVSSADVSNWINQRGHIGMAGEEISTQYKLGRAIHEDPPLEMRLQNLQNWAKSSEYSSGLEKLKTSR